MASLLLGGCHPAKVDPPGSMIAPHASFSKKGGEKAQTTLWWEAFSLPELNEIIEQALSSNLSLKSAVERVYQADHVYGIEFSRKYPSLTVDGSASRNYTNAPLTNHFSSYALAPNISYEIDLFGSIAHDAAAAYENFRAVYEEGHQAALLITSRVAKLYFTIVEQKALLKVLSEQVSVNQTLLELVQLRFQIGEANALDLIQQKQQLASTRSQIPPVEALMETSYHQLAVLLGRIPSKERKTLTEDSLPSLPPLPNLETPESLVCNRPDLRASLRRIDAANQEVSRALADLWPKLNLRLTYEFSSANLSDLFESYLGQILGGLTAPIFDGGRRREDVKLQKSRLREQVNLFNEGFLTAVQEVESALASEEKQVEFLSRLDIQLDLANKNLEKARQRYLNGVSDYLPVIAAIQSLQVLERQIVTEKSRLLQIRCDLYLAIGGAWTTQLIEVEL